ncbi:dihydropyrimidinase [Mixta intestinalis]|uniref:D-phenylhydantoinase n=1 Tax=Mixta intestinalis TaxID=1615494 RepID=A0A6P1Q7Q9_9GAMM|nr:dihydropyrimidinase [Mixta intestinalis]QHM73835.1 D-phenylhydantoinase [Mixta intestinalis]
MSTLIKGGTLVDEVREYRCDLLIEREKIVRIEADISPSVASQVIDATNLLVMPGGIDVHTHFNINVGIAKSCDDFYTGTRAAACGGTTTIVDHMGFGPEGCNLHHQLEQYHHDARGQAVIDYSFHGVVQHVDEAILDELASMVHDEGISSFKFYLTYKYHLNDGDTLRLLKRLKEVGALATVHPENDAVIADNRSRFIREGKGAPIWHALSRPAECEAEAIARSINLAWLAGDAPLYIVHLSNGLGMDYIKLAKERRQSVWMETCPQYLLLDINHYHRPDGLKFVLSPPLRPHSDLDRLWTGISDGSIDTVATDHCTFRYALRQEMAANDFTRCPNGLPGVENRMALLFSEGVMKGRISPSRFVALTSANPARLFGMWPQKGSLIPGSDADLVLFDPQCNKTIHHADLHDNGDYSPWEDFDCQGWPVMTISRGEIVWRDGQFCGKAGHGRFLRRKPFIQGNQGVSK